MKKTLFFLAVIASVFSGCGDVSKQSAKVIDSAVDGLEYQCAGDVQFTKSDGSMECYHTPIGFKVGGVIIGSIDKIPADGIVLPQDILNLKRSDIDNDDVKKLTILLQSIDEDANPENGIKITKENTDKLDVFIDLKKIDLETFKELLGNLLEKNITDETQALKHLQKSMKQLNMPEAEAINLDEI